MSKSAVIPNVMLPSPLQFGPLGGREILILIVVIVLLFFGAKKIPELARSFGRAKGEFERGKQESETELKAKPPSPPERLTRDDLEKIARDLGIPTEGKSDAELREAIRRHPGRT